MAALLACLAAFAITVPWGGWLTRTLLAHGIGKNIRADEPETHQRKAGTATMGGILFLAGLTAITVGAAIAGHPDSLLPLGATLVYGLLGVFDDLQGLKDKAGVGWLARYKFSTQWVLALFVALMLYRGAAQRVVFIPVAGRTVALGGWFVPLTMFYLVGMCNAVNLTDGMDGLAGGISAIVACGCAVVACARGQVDLALFAGALAGALLAFLWFNVHPAKMFMGDTGAQALGAALAALTALSGLWLTVPIMGIVFVVDALSVMVQVAYFRYTRRRFGEGRRVFRMAPFHYHLELGGMPEVQVTARLWIVTAVATLAGVALSLGGGVA